MNKLGCSFASSIPDLIAGPFSSSSSLLPFLFASSLVANQEAPDPYLSWKLNHHHPHHRKDKHRHCLMHFGTAFIVIAIMLFNRCLMIMLWSSSNELARDVTFTGFHVRAIPQRKWYFYDWLFPPDLYSQCHNPPFPIHVFPFFILVYFPLSLVSDTSCVWLFSPVLH